MSLGLFVGMSSPLGQMVLVVIMWKVHIEVRPDLVFLCYTCLWYVQLYINTIGLLF